jgi:hypothetical protein
VCLRGANSSRCPMSPGKLRRNWQIAPLICDQQTRYARRFPHPPQIHLYRKVAHDFKN